MFTVTVDLNEAQIDVIANALALSALLLEQRARDSEDAVTAERIAKLGDSFTLLLIEHKEEL